MNQVRPRIQTYREHVDKLEDFAAFCRDRLDITRIDEITALGLDQYRNTQLHLVKLGKGSEKRSAVTIKKRLGCVRMFLEWCYELEALTALPRNVNRKFARVSLPEPKPKSFTVEEVKRLLSESKGRLKLFICWG